MSDDRPQPQTDAAPLVAMANAPCRRVLVVALPHDIIKHLGPSLVPQGASCRHVSAQDLAFDDLCGAGATDVILSPLTAPGFDAMDIVTILSETGYPGRYRIVSPSMPDLPLIRAEALAMAGALDVDVIALDIDAHPREA